DWLYRQVRVGHGWLVSRIARPATPLGFSWAHGDSSARPTRFRASSTRLQRTWRCFVRPLSVDANFGNSGGNGSIPRPDAPLKAVGSLHCCSHRRQFLGMTAVTDF